MERKKVVIEKKDGTLQRVTLQWDTSMRDAYPPKYSAAYNKEVLEIVFETIRNTFEKWDIEIDDVKSIHFGSEKIDEI